MKITNSVLRGVKHQTPNSLATATFLASQSKRENTMRRQRAGTELQCVERAEAPDETIDLSQFEVKHASCM